MPRPLQGVDWPLAQMLFVQGVGYRMIAEKLGVTEASLRQRAHRHASRQLREGALATVSQAVTKSLAQRDCDTRNLLAEEVERQAALLTECPPASVADLANNRERQGRAVVARTIAETADKVFDWQTEPPQQLITVGRVENMLVSMSSQGVQPALPESVPVSSSEPVSDLPTLPASA